MRNEHGYRGSVRQRQGARVGTGRVGFAPERREEKRLQSVPWQQYRGGVSGRTGGRTAAAGAAQRACNGVQWMLAVPGRRRRRLGPCNGRAEGDTRVGRRVWTRGEGAGGLKLKATKLRSPNREAGQDPRGRAAHASVLIRAAAAREQREQSCR
jgi:hypothetical protein